MRLILIIAIALSTIPLAAAQSPPFGSVVDPMEAPLDPLRRGAARLSAFGGPSYIGVTWRVAAGVEAEGSIGPFSVAFDGRVRVSPAGVYDRDVDELYDVLRLLRYARIEPGIGQPLYFRAGPIQRLTMGSGLLVRDFATTTAWDERTVGAEAALQFNRIELGGFLSDVRPDNLVGGYVLFRPLGWAGGAGPELQIQAIHDLGIPDDEQVTAAAAELSVRIPVIADFNLAPFVGHARYLDQGHGTAVGAAFGADAIADLARLRAAVGLTFSSEAFIPGYVNAFYPVRRPGARIVSSDWYFRDRETTIFADTQIQDAAGGTALFLEFQAVVFGAFELSQYLRRDFGGATGAFGVRLAVTPDRGQNIRFLFDLQREGLDGFRDLFSDLVDEAALTFRLDYTFSPPFRAFIRSRYGYRPVEPLPEGTRRYLVERRFEPMVGLILIR